ncbi:MAG: YceI family protein, partial [Singulisphaera sp.]
ATFRVVSLQPLRGERAGSASKYQLDGDFTLHGTTRKIRVVAEGTPANGFVRLRGNFAVLQTDYGITPYSKAFGAIGVADSLTIWGDLWIAIGSGAPR